MSEISKKFSSWRLWVDEFWVKSAQMLQILPIFLLSAVRIVSIYQMIQSSG